MQVDPEGAPDIGYLGLWSLHCTEVLLRGCRDILCSRLALLAACLADAGQQLKKCEKEKKVDYVEGQMVKKMEFRAEPRKIIGDIMKRYSYQQWWKDDDRFLQNVCRKDVNFWTPLKDMEEWSMCSWQLEKCATPNEVALKSQLLERKEELEQMFQFMKEFCGDQPAARGAMKDFAMNPSQAL